MSQGDGTVDVSFHSPEWHAARIAALTTERVSWEDFKKKQKDEERMAASAAEVSSEPYLQIFVAKCLYEMTIIDKIFYSIHIT